VGTSPRLTVRGYGAPMMGMGGLGGPANDRRRRLVAAVIVAAMLVAAGAVLLSLL
jgi:hypothetical protein